MILLDELIDLYIEKLFLWNRLVTKAQAYIQIYLFLNIIDKNK